jgi:ATP synthase protein I
MDANDEPGAEQRELEQAVERAQRTREHRLRTGEWPVGRALAMMGRFGWSVVAPILLGAFVGRKLDRTFNTGVMFSAALVLAGAVFGFWVIWKAMHRA